MSIVLPNTGATIPTSDAGDAGVWDDLNNRSWVTFDGHTHELGNGVPVPTTGLDIDADFDIGDNALTHVGQVALQQIAALTSGSTVLYADNATHELTWRTSGGTDVQLTDGTTIHTSLTGGIGGDYVTASARFDYDDADHRYTAKTGAPNNWAIMQSGGLRLAPFGTTSAAYTNIISVPGSSWDITLPAALPSTQQVLQIGSTGVMLDTNTLGSNQDIVLSGTGKIQRGNAEVSVQIAPNTTLQTASTISTNSGAPGVGFSTSAAGFCYIPLRGSTDGNATIVQVDIFNTFTGTGNWTAQLCVVDGVAGTFAGIAGTTTTFSTATSPATITTGLPVKLTSGNSLVVKITMGAGMSGSALSARIRTQVAA